MTRPALLLWLLLVPLVAWRGRDGTRQRDLGSSNYPMHCWDAKYQREAASGRYEHVYCVDERGEVWRDGRRIVRRWDGARIEWKEAPAVAIEGNPRVR